MLKKQALITGTTSGIGKAFTENLASRGYNLILVSRNKSALENQKKELCEKYGIEVYIIAKDLSDENAGEEIFDELNKNEIKFEVLINNAGLNECGEFKNTRIEKEIEMIKVHMITLTKLSKLFIQERGTKQGYILNVGSTGSYAPFPLDAVYAASKAYVLNLSLAINTELRKSNISITTVTPGATETQFARKAGIDKSLLFSVFVMHPEKVARIAIKAMFKKKRKITPGLYNKLLVVSMKILPYSIMQRISPIFFADLKKK